MCALKTNPDLLLLAQDKYINNIILHSEVALPVPGPNHSPSHYRLSYLVLVCFTSRRAISPKGLQEPF